MSPQFRDGAFHNREPLREVESVGSGSMAIDFATKGVIGRPTAPVPLVRPSWGATAGDCAATWLGHSTVVLEIGGKWVLADPVWSERASPSATIGPRRQHPAPAPLADLPRLDAVLISHDHYDHLDLATIEELTRTQTAPFVVPLGVGSHLRGLGSARGAHRRAGLGSDRRPRRPHADLQPRPGTSPVGCSRPTPPCGRRGWSRRGTAGCSSAATPATPRRSRSSAGAHGPVDLTILPIGAYDARWPDVHMDPAEAMRTHLDLRGGVMLPIHWATFDLAFHTWAAPADWARLEAEAHDVSLAQPRPGERVDVDGDLPTETWWAGNGRSAGE